MQIATSDVLKVISRSAFDLRRGFHNPPHLGDPTQRSQRRVDLRAGRRRLPIPLGRGDWRYAPVSKVSSESRVRLCGKAVYRGPRHPLREGGADLRRLGGRRISIPTASLGNPSRAMIGVPMLREDRVEGVFVLTQSGCPAVHRTQIGLLQTFADQAVIAVETSGCSTRCRRRWIQKRCSSGSHR